MEDQMGHKTYTSEQVAKATGEPRRRVESWADAHDVPRLGESSRAPFIWDVTTLEAFKTWAAAKKEKA
jgi:hypothetical protein